MENTTLGIKRNINFYKNVAKETGVNVIAGTGMVLLCRDTELLVHFHNLHVLFLVHDLFKFSCARYNELCAQDNKLWAWDNIFCAQEFMLCAQYTIIMLCHVFVIISHTHVVCTTWYTCIVGMIVQYLWKNYYICVSWMYHCSGIPIPISINFKLARRIILYTYELFCLS